MLFRSVETEKGFDLHQNEIYKNKLNNNKYEIQSNKENLNRDDNIYENINDNINDDINDVEKRKKEEEQEQMDQILLMHGGNLKTIQKRGNADATVGNSTRSSSFGLEIQLSSMDVYDNLKIKNNTINDNNNKIEKNNITNTNNLIDDKKINLNDKKNENNFQSAISSSVAPSPPSNSVSASASATVPQMPQPPPPPPLPLSTSTSLIPEQQTLKGQITLFFFFEIFYFYLFSTSSLYNFIQTFSYFNFILF